MNEKELYAEYKRSAPKEDLLFVARALPVLAPEIKEILSGRFNRRDALRMFDRARAVLTPQPRYDERGFWRRNRELTAKGLNTHTKH